MLRQFMEPVMACLANVTSPPSGYVRLCFRLEGAGNTLKSYKSYTASQPRTPQTIDMLLFMFFEGINVRIS
jgi:hypothetical protein